jgi:hypothetical protein
MLGTPLKLTLASEENHWHCKSDRLRNVAMRSSDVLRDFHTLPNAPAMTVLKLEVLSVFGVEPS